MLLAALVGHCDCGLVSLCSYYVASFKIQFIAWSDIGCWGVNSFFSQKNINLKRLFFLYTFDASLFVSFSIVAIFPELTLWLRMFVIFIEITKPFLCNCYFYCDFFIINIVIVSDFSFLWRRYWIFFCALVNSLRFFVMCGGVQ